MSSEASGADRLVEALEQLGVQIVFGLPGVHNLAIWRALACSPIRLVGVRHEQTAAYAADGYARASGRLGVALVTTGPGAANTLGATGEAMEAGSPVLVIATDVSSVLRRPGVHRGLLHETRDQTAMFAPVTKAARIVECAGEIGAAVLASAHQAQAAPSGPVYLGVPTDLLAAEVAAAAVVRAAPPTPQPDPAALERAAGILAAARRPLIWAGGGALRAGAGEAVGELARALAAPVITTYLSRGLLPPDHPCAVPGPIHAREVGPLWDEADVVLAIGTDFDAMMTQEWRMPAPPQLVAITVDPADANKNYAADVTLTGDARGVAGLLLSHVPRREGALQDLRARLDVVGTAVRAAVAQDEPQAAEFLDVMQRVLPDDAVVVADMCIPGYWLGGFHRVPRPRGLAYPMGWGTLGFGFPAAIGACLAEIGPTVCVAGDGGFLFACGELATVAETGVPLTLVLVDDGGYGMLRFDQQHAGEAPFGVDLVRPDFAALSASFGIEAVTVEGFGTAFEAALAGAIAAVEPRVIVVHARLKPPPTTSPRWYRRH